MQRPRIASIGRPRSFQHRYRLLHLTCPQQRSAHSLQCRYRLAVFFKGLTKCRCSLQIIIACNVGQTQINIKSSLLRAIPSNRLIQFHKARLQITLLRYLCRCQIQFPVSIHGDIRGIVKRYLSAVAFPYRIVALLQRSHRFPHRRPLHNTMVSNSHMHHIFRPAFLHMATRAICLRRMPARANLSRQRFLMTLHTNRRVVRFRLFSAGNIMRVVASCAAQRPRTFQEAGRLP